jgi:sortase A
MQRSSTSSGASSAKRSIAKGVGLFLYPFLLFFLVAATFTAILVPIGQAYSGIASMVFTSRTPQFENKNLTLYGDEVADVVNVGQRPVLGQLYAELQLPSAGIDAPVYYGTEVDVLNQGVGTYTGTWLPGQGKSIVMMAHNNTFFRTLPDVTPGDEVTLVTDFGEFEYTVAETDVILYNDYDVIDVVMETQAERLILYTCSNSMAIGATPYRYVVYCDPA